MAQSPAVVLTIAGFDPSSGAGVTADIKTIAAHDCYGIACITALTVQSTLGVHRVEPVSAEIVRQTLEELARDVEIAAVHVGMLGSAAVAKTVAEFLTRRTLPNVVVDPVLRSTSGADLLDGAGIAEMTGSLFPLAAVITPNVEEASTLTGLPVSCRDEMAQAAQKLHELGAKAVAVTGGHLREATDLLSIAVLNGTVVMAFDSAKIESSSTHGTGCAFATALACQLALGRSLPDAVLRAKNYVTAAIANAYPIGQGKGPIHHLHSKAK
jgi:hydroxymethylpyrimidine/phosphomethylpyrimidine kinase